MSATTVMTCDNNPEVMFNACLHEALMQYSASAKHVTRCFSADIEIFENFEGFPYGEFHRFSYSCWGLHGSGTYHHQCMGI
jgi:hypothetical protein